MTYEDDDDLSERALVRRSKGKKPFTAMLSAKKRDAGKPSARASSAGATKSPSSPGSTKASATKTGKATPAARAGAKPASARATKSEKSPSSAGATKAATAVRADAPGAAKPSGRASSSGAVKATAHATKPARAELSPPSAARPSARPPAARASGARPPVAVAPPAPPRPSAPEPSAPAARPAKRAGARAQAPSTRTPDARPAVRVEPLEDTKEKAAPTEERPTRARARRVRDAVALAPTAEPIEPARSVEPEPEPSAEPDLSPAPHRPTSPELADALRLLQESPEALVEHIHAEVELAEVELAEMELAEMELAEMELDGSDVSEPSMPSISVIFGAEGAPSFDLMQQLRDASALDDDAPQPAREEHATPGELAAFSDELEHGEPPSLEMELGGEAAVRDLTRSPSIPPPPMPASEVADLDEHTRSRRIDDDRDAPASSDNGLYQVEETIDRLLHDATAMGSDPAARRRVAEAFAQVASRLTGAAGSEGDEDAAQARSDDYYARQWGRAALRGRAEDVDELGLDPAYEARYAPLFDAMYRRWFRARALGLTHVPREGACMLVANHAGALPWDGIMLRTAMRLDHASRRELRWLVEDFVFHAPFLGAFVNRVGGVRACPENAERLLANGSLVAVFPEGAHGVAKPFEHRYELARFGRGGYVKLALRTGTPIIPTAIVGSEEAHPMLFRTSRLAKLIGMPFLPITATFPWLGPFGLVPLPSRWVVIFGEPIPTADEAPDAERDGALVNRLNERVRAEVQALVRRALDERGPAF